LKASETEVISSTRGWGYTHSREKNARTEAGIYAHWFCVTGWLLCGSAIEMHYVRKVIALDTS